jgi:conjugative transfer signal peptidase TraF
MIIPMALLMGFRYVGSPSVPEGLWFLHQGSLTRGAYALLCLPQNVAELGRRAGYLAVGNCPGNVLPLMKHVIALPGDRVQLASDGVRVNGVLMPRSRVQSHGSSGKRIAARLTQADEIVAPGMIWVLGDSSNSWDSRYFGAVADTRVLGIGTPILTTPADS